MATSLPPSYIKTEIMCFCMVVKVSLTRKGQNMFHYNVALLVVCQRTFEWGQ